MRGFTGASCLMVCVWWTVLLFKNRLTSLSTHLGVAWVKRFNQLELEALEGQLAQERHRVDRLQHRLRQVSTHPLFTQ
jgi:hypothetical protein